MYKLKIIGAGSVGNHLAHAARSLGWSVALCDIDAAALERTRTELYPARYGEWDEAIELYSGSDMPRSVYDLIAIGTPPDSHVPLAIEALAEEPRAILVEKPVCGPGLEGAEELRTSAAAHGIKVFVGYNHVVGEASVAALEAARQLADIETIDVEFREHWSGIFAAHPWLAGPQESYLGFWRRGGGASGEHSHAVNLWQHLARGVGAGEVVSVSASLAYVREGGADYDKLCCLHLRTESGLCGRVVQDVVTRPPRKWARVQAVDGYVELRLGLADGDCVEWERGGDARERRKIAKSRPDDFIRELQHIGAVLGGDECLDSIRLDRGLDTMLVIAAAHRSAREGREIAIDRRAGCSLEALVPVGAGTRGPET